MSKPGRPSLTRRAALLLGLLLAARSFPTARLEPLTPRDAAAAAEFPPYDNPVFALHQRSLAEAAASRALAEAPDTVDTLALVLSQDRIDDALAVLKRIVERHPVYQRKALATLACLAFEQRDYKTALDRFTLYVRLYPDSAYAWAAANRTNRWRNGRPPRRPTVRRRLATARCGSRRSLGTNTPREPSRLRTSSLMRFGSTKRHCGPGTPTRQLSTACIRDTRRCP